MSAFVLFTIGTLLAAAALGYWTPAWGQPWAVTVRVWDTLKGWKSPPSQSIRTYVLAFAVAVLVAGMFVSRPVTHSPVPDGSRESVYAAVRAFQSKNHLVVDGVVGPVTFAKLYPR